MALKFKKGHQVCAESKRAALVKDLDFNQLPVERVLSIQWNVSSDKFGFRIIIKDRPATSSVDRQLCLQPLGFTAPFILNVKPILQDLCSNKLGWDDKFSAEYMHRWQAWMQDLPKLEQLEID